MKRYINLRTRSTGSRSETVVTPEEIVGFAVNDGANAVALTDLSSIHGFTEFSKATEKYKDTGFKPIYGVEIYGMDTGTSSVPGKLTLLAKNQTGLKNIYKIMSLGYMKRISEEKWPCVTYEDIRDNHDGVLVGIECTAQDLSEISGADDKKALICRKFAIADYIEIMSPRYYLDGSDEAVVKHTLSEIIRSIKPKPAIAAAGSNCITGQDELCFDILHNKSSNKEAKASRFLTTEELLDEYSAFLGEETAREIVLDNTNTIADMIESINISDGAKLSFTIENADGKVKSACEKALYEKYGNTVPEPIKQRYESEINNINSHGFASDYVLASALAEKSSELGYLHDLRGCGASSFVAYLMGISETDPLPPHYHCPICKQVEFVDENEYPSGFDLSQKACPLCGEQLKGDGHNIPVEFFAGYYGDKSPDFDLNVAAEIQEDLIDHLGEILGKDRIFYAGTVGYYTDKTAEYLIDDYCADRNTSFSPVERDEIRKRITRVCRTEGNHPGGMVIVPDGDEIFDFAPVGYTGEFQLKENMIPITLTDYHYVPFAKFDILGSSTLSKLKLMEELTSVSARSIDLSEVDISSFFASGDFEGLPFDNPFARKIVDAVRPARFSDLVRVFGFLHGTYVWDTNGEELVEKGCDAGDLVAHRDDVMLTLIKHGIDRKSSFDIAEMVRRGKAGKCLTSAKETLLLEHGIPKWYVDSMRKIRYLFPKAHSVEYVTDYLRMIWYKIYHPAAYNSAVSTVDGRYS